LAAFILWHLGYPDQALRRSHEALALAQELAHPFSLGWALNFSVYQHVFRREGQSAQKQAEALMALSHERGHAHRFAQSMVFRGWALVAQGQSEEGIAQIHQGLAAYQAIWTTLSRPYYRMLLAEAYGSVGQAGEGLRILDEVLDTADEYAHGQHEAELYRLKGVLLLKQTVSDASQAGACFQKALEVSRNQQAKSLELRAATSLARLWQSQGKDQEALDLLAPVYNWFTEGFDTADLQEAKALLAALGR
jgi:predicted ATPase